MSGLRLPLPGDLVAGLDCGGGIGGQAKDLHLPAESVGVSKTLNSYVNLGIEVTPSPARRGQNNTELERQERVDETVTAETHPPPSLNAVGAHRRRQSSPLAAPPPPRGQSVAPGLEQFVTPPCLAERRSTPAPPTILLRSTLPRSFNPASKYVLVQKDNVKDEDLVWL